MELKNNLNRFTNCVWLTPILLASALFIGCGEITDPKKYKAKESDSYSDFDTTAHLQPSFDKNRFDTLHRHELAWALLEPINVAKTRSDDKELSKRFSPGQKALYFIWYLDAEVTNGGFVQFYLNGYGEYIPTIKKGLQLIGDKTMLSLVEKADAEYLANQKVVDSYKNKSDWQPLYELPFKFEAYDKLYYSLNENTMKLIEQYARQHPNEFIKLQ